MQARQGTSSTSFRLDPPHRTLFQIAKNHPDDSLLQILERIDRSLWQTESFSDEMLAVYARVNGLTAMQRIQWELGKFANDFPLDAVPRTRQWLRTGAYLRVEGVIDNNTIGELSAFCDQNLTEPGAPPVRIFDHPVLLTRVGIGSAVRLVLDALPEKLPASADLVILKKRTLLRRTFPDDQMKSQRGNSNNQLWHQDSNAKFNDHPMLTLWITLQDTLGGVRPSLEFIDAEVAYFSPDHGDYSAVLPEYLAGLFPRARTRQIFAAAGDCILFNGLTFHKTFTTENTTLHRDALLVRVVDRITARDFSPEYSDEDVLRVD
jgi:hypothetical protein